jgi:hypothetical protein
VRSSFAAFLRGFTLPFGVTAGQRIVFDGDNGRILVYDNANNLIGFFGPSAGEMVFFIQDDSGSYVNINAGPGAATIELNPADFPTHTIVEGRIQADIDETPEDPFLVLSSPGIDGLAALRLFLIGVGGTGNRARAVIDAADDSDADLVVNDRPIGLGGRRQQVLTGSDSSHSAAGFTITDMSLIDVAGIDDHTYEIHLHSRVELIGAAVSIWNVVLYVDGSEYERFDTIENTAAVTLSALIDAKVYWTAADNSTHDFEVYVEEVVNGQAIQLIGSATARRTLTMTDVGFMEQEP